MRADITEIQRMCTHDGPGLRTVVFMNGCPLACRWCHNPEARLPGNRVLFTAASCIGCQACAACGAHTFAQGVHRFDRTACSGCGRCAQNCPTAALENSVHPMDTADVAAEVLKDKAFYGSTGGLTLSGGEPMYQPAAALDILTRCRQQGVHTAVETCGWFSPAYLPQLAQAADLLLWDIKDTDPARHQANTGVSLQPILDNLFAADRLGAAIRLRCICLEGINADEAHLARVCDIARRLQDLQGVDLLPYHPMGQSKYVRLGLADGFDKELYIPTKEKMQALRQFVDGKLAKSAP